MVPPTRAVQHRHRLINLTILIGSLTIAPTLAGDDGEELPPSIRVVLENTAPLRYPRGRRLPLLLWPVQTGAVADAALQRKIIGDLNERGVAMIATWDISRKDQSLAESLGIARIQQELGLEVCVNANPVMYHFFNGDQNTAHLDAEGRPFFDESITSGRIGCPFRIDHRFEPMRAKIETFVNAYRAAGVPLDFVYGDWEIDGPLEINRAWEASRRCTVCRRRIADIDDFDAFGKAVRAKRAEVTRRCYARPILDHYPKALVGNYGVYPNNGTRYWYDYFEQFVKYHPHTMDQRAPYRRWYDDFAANHYTFAMPVVYPWARLYPWYDFPSGDYRWFYNMLLVASNAGRHTDPSVPIIPFVHWHTIYMPDPGDDTITQMSDHAYQELLWHMLLRGSDTFFLWCQKHESAKEVALLHRVWADALEYADWLNRGVPITFDVPGQQQPVVSALRLGKQILVRRTDFDDKYPGPVVLEVDGKRIPVPAAPGRCQVIAVE